MRVIMSSRTEFCFIKFTFSFSISLPLLLSLFLKSLKLCNRGCETKLMTSLGYRYMP